MEKKPRPVYLRLPEDLITQVRDAFPRTSLNEAIQQLIMRGLRKMESDAVPISGEIELLESVEARLEANRELLDRVRPSNAARRPIEYRVEVELPMRTLQNRLNQIGDEGWSLVNWDDGMFIFQRPK